ncbi:DUF1801 domain-containing protein [Cellulosimicrobium cellulans]|uniref:DUF1801 domain-containing protein n=1 Tax=Cellulosimicrobium cellulans TaxID=1710 RepID=UPI001EDB9453|nr:DUF1801 domain-containing protein [Cellulosimicrobium cellulans]MDF9877987.1 hypothetical protein [Cellulosimicrobium cellulans]UKJ64784.1 DUF1801 domain-containing protein [Cellulosimicrobium cellulans]
MERTRTDVDTFLAALTGRPGEHLRALDQIVAPEMAGLERVLWEGTLWGGSHQQIVGYGGIRQPRPRGASAEWFLVGIAAQKAHLSVYVNAVEDGDYLVRAHAARLGRVRVGAAAVTFARPDDLDHEAFVTMLRRARELAPDAT